MFNTKLQLLKFATKNFVESLLKSINLVQADFLFDIKKAFY